MGKAGLSDVDAVQVGQRIDEREADATPYLRLIPDRRRFLVADDNAMAPFHHVENGPDDRGILAARVHAWRQRKYRVDRGQPARLARHVVRGRGYRPQRRPAHDELGRAKADVIGQVRVATRELRNLHGRATVRPRQIGIAQVFPQPGVQPRPIELFARPDGSRLAL